MVIICLILKGLCLHQTQIADYVAIDTDYRIRICSREALILHSSRTCSCRTCSAMLLYIKSTQLHGPNHIGPTTKIEQLQMWYFVVIENIHRAKILDSLCSQ
jgi:hypothetical protein